MTPEETMKHAWRLIINAIKKLHDEDGITFEKIGEMCGASKPTVQRWYNKTEGGVDTPFANVLRCIRGLGIPLVDIFPDETKSFIRRVSPNAPAEAINGNEAQLKTIHVYDTAGAGSGFIELSEVKPLFSIAIPPTYFRRSDFAVLVDGHSMEPTIIHRSEVGAQQGFEFKANELYVARIPYEGLVVKRIAVSQDREKFIFKSDNKDKDNYPDYELIIAEAEKIIMGRIVWVMYRY
jgi:transcriptional regulator with XRE-family HTH domain